LTRTRIVALFVALVTLSAALGACGGGGSDPQSIVEEATLKGIESGDLDLSLEVGVEGKKPGKVDVSLSGPFQSENEAELPQLDLAFTVKGNLGGKDLDREGGLTLLGNEAYVGYEGTEYEVDSTTFSFVKSLIKKQSGQDGSNEISACQDAVAELEVADFIDNLKDEGSAQVGGTDTDKVSGDLNATGALEALSDLVDDPACAEQLSAAAPLPSSAELDKAKSTVEDSVKSAHVVLYVGDDHIIRRLVAQATIEPPKGSKASARKMEIDLDLTLTGVNEDQTISAPASTKPLSALFVKLGINPIELLGAFQSGGGAQSLGKLLEKFSGIPGAGSSGGGRQAYLECLGEAGTPVDMQDCTGLLQ
jgi:hypothetical protein